MHLNKAINMMMLDDNCRKVGTKHKYTIGTIEWVLKILDEVYGTKMYEEFQPWKIKIKDQINGRR